jgi:hypothetical protein
MADENDVLVEGIRDRIIEGFLKRFIDLDAIKAGDINAIDAAIKSALTMFAPDWLDEQKEIFDIVREALKDDRDLYAILYELGDALVKFAEPRRKVKENGTIRVGDRKHISELTAAEASAWWEKNKSAVRTESQTRVAKFAMRKLPELQAGIEGKLSADELMKLNPDEVIKWLNRAIIVLTVASVVYPPLSVVVIALKLILARYESNNIDVGLSVTALAG